MVLLWVAGRCVAGRRTEARLTHVAAYSAGRDRVESWNGTILANHVSHNERIGIGCPCLKF
jgi:hypothetical protein